MVGLNNIYFEKLSHTNVQNEQSGFGRKLQACKDHPPMKWLMFEYLAVHQILKSKEVVYKIIDKDVLYPN